MMYMGYMTKEEIMNRLSEHYEIAKVKGKGEIFGIFLQGSQNYIDDLFFEDSDVDSRAVYIPNFKELALGTDISQSTVIMDNEEHIDRFDVRKFLDLLKTPGVNNYENLFTEYYIINPKYQEFYDRIRDIREDIVRSNKKRFLMASMGVSKRDLIDLQRRSGGEDYDIETFGYSRKRLSNIMRFNATVKAYLAGKPFGECLKALDQDVIHKVRRTEYYSVDEALEIATRVDKETKELAHAYTDDSHKENYKFVITLEDIFVDMMAASIKDEI